MAIHVLVDDVDFDGGEMYAHVRFEDGSGRPIRVVQSLRKALAEELRARRPGDDGPAYVLAATRAGPRLIGRDRRSPEVYIWTRGTVRGEPSRARARVPLRQPGDDPPR